jgi:uncharacterized membrane protein
MSKLCASWSWSRRLGLIVAFGVFMVAAEASAGRNRGGSFGSRGGFGRSRSSSSRSTGLGRSSGSSRSRGGTSFMPFFFWGGGGGSGGSGGGFMSFLFTIAILVIAFLVIRKVYRLMTSGGSGGGGGGGSGRASVVKLQLGFFGSARDVQSQLARMARSGRLGSASGEAGLLSEAALLLTRNLDSLRYAAIELLQKKPLAKAEAGFQRMATQERSKYEMSGLRADENGVRESEERPDETYEVSEAIVVTLIVATSLYELLEDLNVNDEAGVRAALESVSAVPGDELLALEVIWVPDDAEGRLTEDEVLELYPELMRI